jgi:hypothetical protein
VLRDGICASWLPAGRGHAVPPGQHPRVARHGLDGSCRWSAPAVLEQLSYPARVRAGNETGWEERFVTWTPRTIEAHHWEPLLVSSHRVAATFADGSSGIAVTFFLDTSTGQLIATSRPGSSHHKAISGPGEFLIGFQGYRPSRTSRYDDAGAVTREWPTHAMLLISRDGHISGPESENVLPSRSHYVTLEPDGTVLRGPADNRAVISKIMLLRDGCIAFTVHDELIILPRTGLGPLDGGIWPCADGGLHGNPVLR